MPTALPTRGCITAAALAATLAGTAHAQYLFESRFLTPTTPIAGPLEPRFEVSIDMGMGPEGPIVAIGVPTDDTRGVDAGAVYVFNALTGEEIQKAIPSGVQPGDRFGTIVRIEGGRIVAQTGRTMLGPINANPRNDDPIIEDVYGFAFFDVDPRFKYPVVRKGLAIDGSIFACVQNLPGGDGPALAFRDAVNGTFLNEQDGFPSTFIPEAPFAANEGTLVTAVGIPFRGGAFEMASGDDVAQLVFPSSLTGNLALTEGTLAFEYQPVGSTSELIGFRTVLDDTPLAPPIRSFSVTPDSLAADDGVIVARGREDLFAGRSIDTVRVFNAADIGLWTNLAVSDSDLFLSATAVEGSTVVSVIANADSPALAVVHELDGSVPCFNSNLTPDCRLRIAEWFAFQSDQGVEGKLNVLNGSCSITLESRSFAEPDEFAAVFAPAFAATRFSATVEVQNLGGNAAFLSIGDQDTLVLTEGTNQITDRAIQANESFGFFLVADGGGTETTITVSDARFDSPTDANIPQIKQPILPEQVDWLPLPDPVLDGGPTSDGPCLGVRGGNFGFAGDAGLLQLDPNVAQLIVGTAIYSSSDIGFFDSAFYQVGDQRITPIDNDTQGQFAFITAVPPNVPFQLGVNTLDGVGGPGLLTIESFRAIPINAKKLDGLFITGAFQRPLALQSIATGFGDDRDPAQDGGAGSELNALFIDPNVADNRLRIGVTGNLESAADNAFILFLDTAPGGDAVLDGNGFFQPPSGARFVSALQGLAFDTGFRPDYALVVNLLGDIFFADLVDLRSNTNTFLGQNFLGIQDATLTGGDDSLGVRIAFDNANTQGVGDDTPGTEDQGAFTALSGLELSIPLDAIDLAAGATIGASVVLVGGGNPAFLSNQTLPPLPLGTGNLATEPVDFNQLAGDQFVALGTTTVCPGDTNGDGAVTALDISNVLSNFGATNASGPSQGDLDGDGNVTALDISIVLSNFGNVCS